MEADLTGSKGPATNFLQPLSKSADLNWPNSQARQVSLLVQSPVLSAEAERRRLLFFKPERINLYADYI